LKVCRVMFADFLSAYDRRPGCSYKHRVVRNHLKKARKILLGDCFPSSFHQGFDYPV
jgi:hypothetical protein